MRKSAALLLAALIAITLPFAPRASPALPVALWASETNADELIKRHLEALGGEKAVRAIGSVLSTAEIEILGTGLKGTVRSQSLRPCLSFTEISLGPLQIREGYDGKRIWTIDPNGKLQFRRDPASLEYQKTICLLESQEYLFGRSGFEYTALGTDTVRGIPCYVLEMDVEKGTSAKLFLNDSTYLIEEMEIKAPEGNTVQTFGDYRRVKGVMFPFFTKTEIAALSQTIEMRYQSITANAAIDPIVFLPPSADVKDYRFAGGASGQAVPFKYRSRHLFIPARIGDRGREVLFLIDSGASMTVIDSSIAAQMGLPLEGRMPGAGAGGMTDFTLTRMPGFSIAGIEFSEQTAISFPVAGLLRQFDETEIGGILGYDFLSRFITKIDYERELISFFEPDSLAPRVGETTLEAPLVHNIFSLPVTIDAAAGAFLLDTGANSSLVMGGFAEKNSLVAGRRTLDMAIRGAGGDEKAALCRFDSLRIGGVTIVNPVLAITSSKKGISAIESVNGIVGNDILERFTVTLDYKRQQVLLEKNGRFGESFFKDRSGLELARREDRSIVVVAVIPDSPAEEAGIQSGDILLTVGGTRAAQFESIREIMSLFEASEGTTYTIEISRAKETIQKTLTLAE
jgi:predicted aspartyl protease